ncbi:MAG TPA: hypothetical protein VHB72_02790 [Candidatus Saccharimonadales bacterium]|nr:hypothetical protein [Candidatus Saccharimonadales bacterium]
MDFNRAPSPQGVASNQPAAPAPTKKNRKNSGKWTRIGIVAIGAAVVILLIALIVLLIFGGGKSEDKYVDNNRLQAVFLNTGQVYFGNVKTLNNKFFVLTNIYYLQATNSNGSSSSASTSNSASNVTLVKLGCELHEPYDQMVINSDQVTFWENLQPGGQVAKAVSTFEQQNPNGQKCADQSSSSSTNSTNATQNASGNNGSSNNSSSNSSGSSQ